ncbi:MAG: GIY-YIG nuclease family protein [Azoarcus sp.]|nr:GIY-YIG nuclease family protein [Azoarcus sp.]
MTEIKVTDILQLEELKKYKLHLGSHDGKSEPLDSYLKDEKEWKRWNEWRNPKTYKNEWNRGYIFSLIDFYPRKNTWLFGGIFKVKNRPDNANYIIEEIEEYKKYVGKLLLNFKRPSSMRGRSFLLENQIDKMAINQLLEHKYTGEVFPGFDSINHDFYHLVNIFKLEKFDWETALESVKGIYLLTNKETGKSYIGSAYSDGGIWSRWSQYINTSHGWNEQIIALVKEKGEEYIRKNFKFSILEIHGMYVSEAEIKKRESYWKEKLMTREHGYNSN